MLFILLSCMVQSLAVSQVLGFRYFLKSCGYKYCPAWSRHLLFYKYQVLGISKSHALHIIVMYGPVTCPFSSIRYQVFSEVMRLKMLSCMVSSFALLQVLGISFSRFMFLTLLSCMVQLFALSQVLGIRYFMNIVRHGLVICSSTSIRYQVFSKVMHYYCRLLVILIRSFLLHSSTSIRYQVSPKAMLFILLSCMVQSLALSRVLGIRSFLKSCGS